jgi:hypothetical protein
MKKLGFNTGWNGNKLPQGYLPIWSISETPRGGRQWQS